MKHLVRLIAAVAPLGGPVVAADLAPDYSVAPITDPAGFEQRWQFTAAVYGWGPSVNGSAGLGDLPTVNIDKSFLDILENIEKLDIGFMGLGEARYGRFGVAGDLIYAKVSTDGVGPLGILNASLTNELIVGTMMGEYRVFDQGGTSLDVMAGARVWGITGDFEVTTAGEGVGLISGGADKYWVDPMIGVKGRVQGASPWYLTGWAMIGGFGVSSDLGWDLFGGVGYQFNQTFSLVAGYRGTAVDYSDENFLFDVILHGPVMGGVFRF